MALTYLSASPGLHLLPPCRAPGLLPPSDGSPRSGDLTAAGEHFQGEQYYLACQSPPPPKARGQTKGPLCSPTGPAKALVSGEQKALSSPD